MSDIGVERNHLLEQFEAERRDGALLIAFVSDCHAFQSKPIDLTDANPNDYAKRPDPDLVAGRLTMILAELNAITPRPDFLIFGGDLTERGRSGEWRRFFEIAETSKIPYYLLLGNHDHSEDENRWHDSRAALRRELPSLQMCRTPREALQDIGLYYVAREGPFRLLFVDCPDAITRTLEPTQKSWLAAQLTAERVPTIISIHRPFLKVGNEMDDWTTRDPELLGLIGASGCVRVILSGHTHKARAWLHGGIAHLISSSCFGGINDQPGYRLICVKNRGVTLTAMRYLPEPGIDGPGRFQPDQIVLYSEDVLQST